nr:glucose-6-phosphate isomerase 1, chloroplastic [Tanacetum cinerariifolium]
MDQSAGLRMFGSDTIKLDRMDGMNFTHWKEKTKFMLTAFKVCYVLEGPPIGVLIKDEQRKRDQDETLCRGYILRKNNKGSYKKRKGTWNSAKDNQKDKKPFFELCVTSVELHMTSVTTTTDDRWTIKDMLKQGIISYNGKHKDKCKICVQAKMKRKHFPKVDSQSEILELVHSDICDLNGQLSRGGNRSKRYLVFPYEDLNGVPIAIVARFRVVSKSMDRILVSYGGWREWITKQLTQRKDSLRES